MTTYKIIFDTDIGTDVDDILALALVLNSPQAELLGITCVYGNVDLRAQMTLKFLQSRGINIPIYTGASQPLMRLRSTYWAGHEGQGILDESTEVLPVADEFAPHYIVNTILEHPNEVYLVAIGPLTNIALALQEEPQIADLVAGIVIMGGVVRGNDDLALPVAEHNILCDPHAAHVVFSSGASILLTPLNITVKAKISEEHVTRLEHQGTPFHQILADQIRRYPRFQQYGYTSPHDPMAVATLLYPHLIETIPVEVQVELAGQYSQGVTIMRENPQGNVRLVTQINVKEFEQLLIETLEK